MSTLYESHSLAGMNKRVGLGDNLDFLKDLLKGKKEKAVSLCLYSEERCFRHCAINRRWLPGKLLFHIFMGTV